MGLRGGAFLMLRQQPSTIGIHKRSVRKTRSRSRNLAISFFGISVSFSFPLQVVHRRVLPHAVPARRGAGAQLRRDGGGPDARRDGRDRLRSQPRTLHHRRRREGNPERFVQPIHAELSTLLKYPTGWLFKI